MNIVEARTVTIDYFADNVRSSMRTILGGDDAAGASWTIDGATVYEWPTIRSWANYSQWIAQRNEDSDEVRLAINNVGASLSEAVVESTAAETAAEKLINDQDGETKVVIRGGQTADIAKLPFYQIMFSPSGLPETSFPSSGERRYIMRGTFDIYCWDEANAGHDGLYAMAEAAKLCMENKRVTNQKGSIAFFQADQDAVEVLGEKALIELQVPYEHADRR